MSINVERHHKRTQLMKRIMILLTIIVATVLTACSEDPATTPTTIPPTQTPIIITATPLPATITPSPTATFTITPTLVPTQTQVSQDSSASQDTAPVAKPISNIKPNCTPRQDWQAYTVKVSDTLGRLADQTDSTLNALANANCLVNPNIIVVGQTLRLPKQPVSTNPDPTIEDLISKFNGNLSTAKPGDTITFTWEAEAGTVISIINMTLDTTIIASNLSHIGSLSYNIPTSIDTDEISAMSFNISGKLVRDGEDIFASPIERIIAIQGNTDDCDRDGSTDTTDDDCEDDTTDDCDSDGSTDTTDDDCEDDTSDDCDSDESTDTIDDDCEDDTSNDCDSDGSTDTTDDDCEDDTSDDCDSDESTDTTDDDCPDDSDDSSDDDTSDDTSDDCDSDGSTDTTDDDCEDDSGDDGDTSDDNTTDSESD